MGVRIPHTPAPICPCCRAGPGIQMSQANVLSAPRPLRWHRYLRCKQEGTEICTSVIARYIKHPRIQLRQGNAVLKCSRQSCLGEKDQKLIFAPRGSSSGGWEPQLFLDSTLVLLWEDLPQAKPVSRRTKFNTSKSSHNLSFFQ